MSCISILHVILATLANSIDSVHRCKHLTFMFSIVILHENVLFVICLQYYKLSLFQVRADKKSVNN